jgi:hypothetical protein
MRGPVATSGAAALLLRDRRACDRLQGRTRHRVRPRDLSISLRLLAARAPPPGSGRRVSLGSKFAQEPSADRCPVFELVGVGSGVLSTAGELGEPRGVPLRIGAFFNAVNQLRRNRQSILCGQAQRVGEDSGWRVLAHNAQYSALAAREPIASRCPNRRCNRRGPPAPLEGHRTRAREAVITPRTRAPAVELIARSTPGLAAERRTVSPTDTGESETRLY